MAMTKSQRLARKKRFTKRSQEAQWASEFVPRHPDEDPREVVLNARCRHTGRADPQAVGGDMWGDHAGRAIAIGADAVPDLGKADRATLASDLWHLFKRLDAADEAYFRRIIGRPRFPNVSRTEYLPEAFETRADHAPREWMSEDDKDRAAVRAWMRWQGYLGEMPCDAHCAIVSAMRQRVMLSHGGRLTGAGEVFFSAMRTLLQVERRSDRGKRC